MSPKRPTYSGDRTCQLPGCTERAPGTHPFCRTHERRLPSDTVRQLRFGPPDPELLEQAVAVIQARE